MGYNSSFPENVGFDLSNVNETLRSSEIFYFLPSFSGLNHDAFDFHHFPNALGVPALFVCVRAPFCDRNNSNYDNACDNVLGNRFQHHATLPLCIPLAARLRSRPALFSSSALRRRHRLRWYRAIFSKYKHFCQ